MAEKYIAVGFHTIIHYFGRYEPDSMPIFDKNIEHDIMLESVKSIPRIYYPNNESHFPERTVLYFKPLGDIGVEIYPEFRPAIAHLLTLTGEPAATIIEKMQHWGEMYQRRLHLLSFMSELRSEENKRREEECRQTLAARTALIHLFTLRIDQLDIKVEQFRIGQQQTVAQVLETRKHQMIASIDIITAITAATIPVLSLYLLVQGVVFVPIAALIVEIVALSRTIQLRRTINIKR